MCLEILTEWSTTLRRSLDPDVCCNALTLSKDLQQRIACTHEMRWLLQGGLEALRVEPRRIIGMDVEYAHFKARGSAMQVVAAEVCLVAEGGCVVYQSFCHPGENY